MRRFEFVVDHDHARAVNEVVADVRRLRASAVIATVLLGVATAWLVAQNHPWSWILAVVTAIGAATSLWVAVPRRAAGVERLYADGELVPAVVSETTPRGAMILALVDVSKPNARESRYALVTRKVRSLPGHTAEPGERVPSVSVPIDRSGRPALDVWQSVSAMPIAWGTRDANVIERARAAIGEAEWKLLTDNLELAATVRKATAKRLLLDPHELPDELRKR